jgi:hypothetical protein
MAKMNFYDDTWDLRAELCPCDLQFNDWLERSRIHQSNIFHFGSGSHHVVGLKNAEGISGNHILAITASTGEYDAFMKLAIERPEVEKHYKCIFGDIYQLDARLLPAFDVVTLFHLCEFFDERNVAYGCLTDRQVLEILTAQTRRGGYILFYTKSFAFDTAKKIIDVWETEAGVEKVGMHELLLVYRKT